MIISSRQKRRNCSAAWPRWLAWHMSISGGFQVSRGCWSSDSLRALFRSLTCTSLQHINKPNSADKFIISLLRYADLTRFVFNLHHNIIHRDSIHLPPPKKTAEITFFRKTLDQNYIIPKVHFPELALTRNYIERALFPKRALTGNYISRRLIW